MSRGRKAGRRTGSPVRRWGRILLALALVGGGATGAMALTRSPLFGLARIDVVGVRSLSRADVIAASGLHPGQSALGVSLPAVAARVRALPGVETARVEREGSLGIRIVVVERVPAVEVTSGSERFWFDQTGQPLALAKAPRVHLPVIDIGPMPASASDPQATATPVDAMTMAGPTVESVLQLWRLATPSARARIGRFTAQPDGTLAFRFDGFAVTFGTPTDIPAKLQAIDLVEAAVHAGRGRLVALDVTAPDHPAARLAG